ncbi:hypothetical protein P154DRAFT_553504 [Amniculicola lignicola CBS 123094]|uniref:Chalcone isomerase domain-containing protein n=1 Tax=Amniculicola lignicola CBS 123094 TaxID=1392246 RepID=A0A6A5WJD1_9PLEO|nr:hypothetical protein P154DRAFT_553504 [Amniculicola lignicola CBS 123094]
MRLRVIGKANEEGYIFAYPRPLTRRPLFRCLNAPAAPVRRPQQLRNASHQQPPRRYQTSPESRGRADEPNFAQRDGFPRIAPIDAADFVPIHRAQAMERERLIRKRNFLFMGAVLSMIAPMFLVQLWDLPEDNPNKKVVDKAKGAGEKALDAITGPSTKADAPRIANEAFQGKKVVIAAGDKIIAAPVDSKNPQASDADAIELVETGTSYVPYFPRTITLPTSSTGPEDIPSQAEYTLLGLGIRKVSFMRVQVYVVGLYVKTSHLSTLQNHLINTVNPRASALIPGEKDDLRTALLDAEKSTQIWESILARDGIDGVDMAWRVVPTRGTDFKHLQDGWMRGIASRTDEVRRKQQELLRQQASESKRIALPQPVDDGEFSDESFGLAMKDFKALFTGRGKAPKGSVLILSRNRTGVLEAFYQPLVKTNKGEKVGALGSLGEVRDPRVSRLVWLLYLAGKEVSSPLARESIVEGCVGIVERPVGTVEGRIS